MCMYNMVKIGGIMYTCTEWYYHKPSEWYGMIVYVKDKPEMTKAVNFIKMCVIESVIGI